MRRWLTLGLLLLPLLAQARTRRQDDVVEGGPEPDRDYLMPCETCHEELGFSNHTGLELTGCTTCHVVEGAADGETHKPLREITPQTCVKCHSAEPPAHPHEPVQLDECTECHDPHSTDAEGPHLHTATGAETCLACHEEVGTIALPHTALRLGECGGCHVAHGSEHQGMLKVAPGELCAECHEEQLVANTYEHLPASLCTNCHTPHGGEHPSALAAPQAELCGWCHPSVGTRLHVHSAVVLGRCSGCHDPHGSEVAHKLHDAPLSAVCFRCHADDITGRPTAHPPVSSGQCQICHDPHDGAAPGVLHTTTDITCRQCHAETVAESYATPHLALSAYGCTGCHDPHASDEPALLKGPLNEVCISCHPRFSDGYHISTAAVGGAHPISGVPDTLVPERELSCISCHAPHGGDKPYLWYRVEDELALCSECHGTK